MPLFGKPKRFLVSSELVTKLICPKLCGGKVNNMHRAVIFDIADEQTDWLV